MPVCVTEYEIIYMKVVGFTAAFCASGPVWTDVHSPVVFSRFLLQHRTVSLSQTPATKVSRNSSEKCPGLTFNCYNLFLTLVNLSGYKQVCLVYNASIFSMTALCGICSQLLISWFVQKSVLDKLNIGTVGLHAVCAWSPGIFVETHSWISLQGSGLGTDSFFFFFSNSYWLWAACKDQVAKVIQIRTWSWCLVLFFFHYSFEKLEPIQMVLIGGSLVNCTWS